MLNEILTGLDTHSTGITALATGITALATILAVCMGAFQLIKYLDVRSRTSRDSDFEHYHKLIKELVEPATSNGSMKMDRQIAIIFELKNFPRYLRNSVRVLRHLKATWGTEQINEPLIAEIDLSLEFMGRWIICRWCFKLWERISGYRPVIPVTAVKNVASAVTNKA